MKQPLAVLTMVRADYHWARLWKRHFAGQVNSLADLYVLIDGEDAQLRAIFDGCNVIETSGVHHDHRFEVSRLKVKHDLIRELQQQYHVVMMTDVDEFVCVDPEQGAKLCDYLPACHQGEKVRSSFGIEVFHWTERNKLDLDRPILSQRKYGYVAPGYCKPNAFYREFGRANHHRIHGEPWHIDPHLWLFHMRYADRDLTRSYAQARKLEHRVQKSANGTAGAKSWARPMVAYRGERDRLRDGPPPVDLTAAIQAERIAVMLEYYAQHNRIGARFRKSPLYRIPDRFADCV